MAVEEMMVTRSVEASADLSTKQFYGMKIVTAGLATIAALADVAYGVLQDKPAAAGRVGMVCIRGRCPVQCGGTVGIGVPVAFNASGKVVAAATGDRIVGITREMGVTNQVISVDLNCEYLM